MKNAAFTGIALAAVLVLLFGAVGEVVESTVPAYPDALGDMNYTEKITGLYLVEQSAARDNNVILYGSSELRTFEVSTHPSNFFRGQRDGIQVNLVGRGSCQSLIHAMSIAATGGALADKKVVLITSPQSYVEGGIAPDLFMANFSPQQYAVLMQDDTIPAEMKEYISKRVKELTDDYNRITGSSTNVYTAAGLMAESAAASGDSVWLSARDAALTPYYRLSEWLLNLKDKASAGSLIREVNAEAKAASDDAENAADNAAANGETPIDWALEEERAVAEAQKLTDNNEFGILNEYYTTYIGRKLNQQKDKDRNLSYSVSKEYDDLRLLLDLCKLKGIEPLFIHVPLHGAWSDYTGFAKDRRDEYYRNVREIVGGYENVELLDLTEYEYEQYFLCDIMHLGWKGWLAVDQAIDRYVHEG